MHYIYKISNIVNNKNYIGQTNDPDLRWSQHKSNAKYNRGTQVITRAIIKYGADNFHFEVIASCLTQDDADKLEEIIIAQYGSCNPINGYNVAAGGNTTPRTEEFLKKLSEGLQRYYETHESHMKGKILTEEWKDNMSKAAMGKPGTNIGKTFDNEWRIKISKSQVGKIKLSKRRFSQKIEMEICRLYFEEEKSTYALGNQFGCQRTLISDILYRNSIIRRKSNYTGHSNGLNLFTIDREKEICEIYLSGIISIIELSKQFNCGKTTIRDILLRNNIKL